MTFTIAVWNVRHGGGRRRQGIAEVIGAMHADAEVVSAGIDGALLNSLLAATRRQYR